MQPADHTVEDMEVYGDNDNKNSPGSGAVKKPGGTFKAAER